MAKKHTVLCVDDEKNILSALKRLLRKEDYEFLTASSGDEALQLMDAHTVHLVMSDQRMPGMSGTELFEKVKEKHPDVIRIILTGYTEIDAITGAINKGNIYKFFLKPWNDETLKLEIQKALDQYDLIQLNRELVEKIAHQNEELLRVNDLLEQKVEERTRELALRNQALELSRVILDQLPDPVLGIDNEGFVIMMNRKAADLKGRLGALSIGENIASIFDHTIEQKALLSIATQTMVTEPDVILENISWRVDIIPLIGRFHHKGAIIVMRRTCKV